MSWLSQGISSAQGAVGDAVDSIKKLNPVNNYNSDVQNPWQDEDRNRQVGSINEGAGYNSQDAANQQALIAALQARANGTGGPSAAQMQLQQATDQNMQKQAGLAAMNRGVSPGLMQRQLEENQANSAQQMAGQSGILRLNEQNDADAMLMQALNGSRSQNLGQMQAGEQNNLGNKGLAVNAGLGNSQINAGVAGQNSATGGGLINNFIGGQQKAASALLGTVGLAEGGVVPGPDAGVDTQPAMLRGQEVVVPPESPLYNAALLDAMKRGAKGKPATKPQPASSPLLEALRAHFMGDSMGPMGGGAPQTMGVGA